jgi:hypothetical protein
MLKRLQHCGALLEARVEAACDNEHSARLVLLIWPCGGSVRIVSIERFGECAHSELQAFLLFEAVDGDERDGGRVVVNPGLRKRNTSGAEEAGAGATVAGGSEGGSLGEGNAGMNDERVVVHAAYRLEESGAGEVGVGDDGVGTIDGGGFGEVERQAVESTERAAEWRGVRCKEGIGEMAVVHEAGAAGEESAEERQRGGELVQDDCIGGAERV